MRGEPVLHFDEMPDGGEGMLGDHARAGIAHDYADALAHSGLVAMVFARVAGSFRIHFLTPIGFPVRIDIEVGTRGADCFAAMSLFGTKALLVIPAAVQSDHLRDGALFALPAFCYVGRILHKPKDSTGRIHLESNLGIWRLLKLRRQTIVFLSEQNVRIL